MEEQSQQQQAFTFASPISSSETSEDALDFDYQSWIEQSKIHNRFSSQGDKLWMDHAEAINKIHREMLLLDLPEEAYEMSLRDLSELSLSRAATEETANSSVRPNNNKKARRKKTPFMERAGLIIKLFMLPPRAAAATAPERKKSFSSSTMTTSFNGGSVQNSISEAGSETSDTQGNSMPIKSYQDSSNSSPSQLEALMSQRSPGRGDAPRSALQSKSPSEIHLQSTKRHQIPDLCTSSNLSSPFSTSNRHQQVKFWQVNPEANFGGGSHGNPAKDGAPTQNPPKPSPNPSIQQPIQCTTVSEYQFHKRLEGFRQEERSRNKPSRSAELLGDEATTPAPPRSKKSTRMGQEVPPTRGRGWQGPPSAGVADRVKDPVKLLSTQVSLHPLPNSYAQVVAASRRIDASLGAPPSVWRSSSATGHLRRVRFIDSPDIAAFLKGSIPADILLLGRQALASKTHTTKMKLRSCLKSPLITAQSALACNMYCNPSIMPSSAVASDPIQQDNHFPAARVFEEQSEEFSWQTVKGKYWWRKGKLKSSDSAPINQQPSPTIFKLKTRGRCFNCLARGHQVVNCRDPPTCWRCRGSGHISFECSRRPSERRHHRSIPPFLKQRSHIQQQAEDETWSFSDAIHIIPRDHPTTTQQLEAWFGAIDSSRIITSVPQVENKGADGITISCPVACSPKVAVPRLETMNLNSINVQPEMRAWRQLWKNSDASNSPSKTNPDIAKRATKLGEQFFREAVPCSDAIHIIPLVSFTEINMKSRPDNKSTENMMQHTITQQSDDVVVPPIMAPQQPRMLNELHIGKLNERKLSPSKSIINQSMTKTPNAQGLVIEYKMQHANVQQLDAMELPLITAPKQPIMLDGPQLDKLKMATTRPVVQNAQKEQRCSPKLKTKLNKKKQKSTIKMAKTPTAQQIDMEDALTVQKQPSELELVNESNLVSMLQKFKEAVTKPLVPCLLETPNFKSNDKEEKKEEHKRNPGLKIKLKEQKITNKMAEKILATSCSILGKELALDKLTLQQYLDTYKKPLSLTALEACKNLIAVADKKSKHKKSSVVVKTVKKREKSGKVD